MAPIFTSTANHGKPIWLTALAIGAGSFELGVGHDAHQHGRGEDVEHGADQQRTDDADRHVARRVLRLGAGGGDRLEADVGEEDRRGAAVIKPPMP